MLPLGAFLKNLHTTKLVHAELLYLHNYLCEKAGNEKQPILCITSHTYLRVFEASRKEIKFHPIAYLHRNEARLQITNETIAVK